MFAPESNVSATRQTNGSFEKAKGFINIYLPTGDGGRVKVGALPLRESNQAEKATLEYLTSAKTEEEFTDRLKNVANKMQFEFNKAEAKVVTLAL